MKYILFFLGGIFCLPAASAQIITLADKTSLKPLAGLNITGSSGKFSTTSDNKGKADITAAATDETLTISGLGFEEVRISVLSIRSCNQSRILLTEKSLLLDEIVISASRFEEKKQDAPMQIEVIKAADIERMNQPTTAEMLMQTGQVFVQKSQLGGGSPVLRGFEASRVLLVIDGIRMNNAIFRTGHLHNVLRTDQNILDRTEVIFGPGSVMYGSDALGGVIHLFTRNPVLAEAGQKWHTSGSAFARYGSAMNEATGHLDLNTGTKKFASLTSATFSRFGDLMQGNIRRPELGGIWDRTFYVRRFDGKDSILPNPNTNLQKGSGYYQYDLLQKFLFQSGKNLSHIINLQYSGSSDVNRYDRLTEVTSSGIPRFAQWYYGPEKRLLSAYSLRFGKTPMADKGRLTLSYQWVEESRHSRRFNSPWLTSRTERVHVAAVNFDFSREAGRHELRYGVEGTFNAVQSRAAQRHVDDGSVKPASTRYPDGGSHYFSAAAYVTDTRELTDKWILALGARLNYVGLRALFTDSSVIAFPFDRATQNNVAANGNLGVIYLPGRQWRVALSGATGFRSPNVDDLGKVFDSQPGTLIVPNPAIRPEYTANADLNVSKVFGDVLKLEAIGFYTYIWDFISVQPATFNGNDSIMFEGVMSKVLTNTNADAGFITGASFRALADVHPNFSLDGTVTYTYGRLKQAGGYVPLDHIPPLFGRISAILKIEKFRAEFFTLFNGRKHLKDYSPNGEDNLQYATPWGMPGWFTLNLRASYSPLPYLQIQAALENLSDVRYRHFASGISAPGRNLIISLRTRF